MHRIPFRFTGLHSLRIKETDRIEALEREARKLGYVLHDEQDSILTWNGETCAADALPTIDTYEDHRMAMAFAPCCLKTKRIAINHPQVVTKSYPGYWADLQTVGFEIKPL
jgi:3-phosphoshikimate 1-carboxyvinyltransferase